MPRRSPADPAAALAPRRTTLPGGLRVVTEFLPAVHSASVGVWVGVGSRDEGATVAGAAHFLEHLLFKSTPTRSAVDIAQAMDAVGGELNAFTAKEHTCYYAHVLGSDLPLAVDLVADVVLNGRCAADDVEVERDVVLEEIAMRDDDPEDALADMFLAALFGDHPVGRPVIGSAQSVSVMTRAQLQSFHLRRYTPERMVVAAAGNVDHDGLVALVREHFGSRLVRGRRPVAPRKGTGRVNGSPRLTLVSRDAEQTHVSLGIRTPGRGWEHRWALSVLHTALGGGLSSRLFQEVRETRGLAYSVYSALDLFADSGALSVYAACLPERFADVMRVTADVLESVVSFTFGAPPPDVVQRLSALGLLVSITVTSVYEAGVAIAAGADSLVVQGPAAGGHRGTFAPDMEPGTESLHQLLDRIGSAHDVPLVAAGGLGTAEDVAAVLRRGAIAAQVGTALLLADEAGTNAAHRAALKNPEFDATLVTRAFSGRYARGLANNFTRLLDHVAPLGYPEVHQMTKPIRAAAVQADDPHGTNLWAGSAHRKTRPGPAADIIASLTPDVCSA